MNAKRPMRAFPCPNYLLTGEKPPVMERIAAKTKPSLLGSAQKIDVTRQMARSVDNINRSVLKKIQSSRERPQRLPIRSCGICQFPRPIGWESIWLKMLM